ncbi:MAG: TVP38/TMEM64 family protein, partial [Aeoliella sp.]
RDFKSGHPVLVYGIAFAIYVAITGLSLPGAAGLTILIGWLFDWWQAVVLVSFASTTGATLAFLLSRYLFRDSIQKKFGDRLTKFNEALGREGAFYLFTLRLVPLVPFFVINVVMGLTPVKAQTFWWVSQLGMLPGTLLYTYVGNAVPDLQTLADQGAGAVFSGTQLLQFGIAFGLLGVFPLIAKWAVAKLKPAEAS